MLCAGVCALLLVISAVSLAGRSHLASLRRCYCVLAAVLCDTWILCCALGCWHGCYWWQICCCTRAAALCLSCCPCLASRAEAACMRTSSACPHLASADEPLGSSVRRPRCTLLRLLCVCLGTRCRCLQVVPLSLCFVPQFRRCLRVRVLLQ